MYIVNEEGEKIPLPDGDYTLEDGRTLTIADSGKIAKSEGKGREQRRRRRKAKQTATHPRQKHQPEAAPTPPAKKPPVKRAAKSKQDKLAIEDEVIEEEKEVEEEIKEELMDDAYIIDLINRVLDERFPAEIVEEEMSAEDKAVTELKALLQAQTEELTDIKITSSVRRRKACDNY